MGVGLAGDCPLDRVHKHKFPMRERTEIACFIIVVILVIVLRICFIFSIGGELFRNRIEAA